MISPPRPAVALPAPQAAAPVRVADYVALAKPRLNLLVVATAVAGHFLGAERIGTPLVLHTAVGTAMVAGGASALNQVLEWRTDALMRRTHDRPIPAGRVSVAAAAGFAVALSALGLADLALCASPVAALIALATLVSYVAVYTPLKRRTPLATLVGAVSGALPPMIGWAAARGSLQVEAWTLFAIVFFWQMPHFLAIAWIYREDYARAGLQTLPVVEPDGRSTAQQVALYASMLVPVSLVPTLVGLAGPVYFGGAIALGLAFLALALRFARSRNRADARRLFLGSITYLPLLWGLLLAGR